MSRIMPSLPSSNRQQCDLAGKEVTEIELLLPVAQIASLDGAARANGCTIGHLIRQVLQEFLKTKRLN